MLAKGVTCKLLHCQARELKHAWFCRRARHEPGGRVSQTDCAGRPPLAPALRCAAHPSTGAPSGKRGDRAACPAQRQKEILRNKKERRFQRDAHALKSNPEAIKEELKGVRGMLPARLAGARRGVVPRGSGPAAEQQASLTPDTSWRAGAGDGGRGQGEPVGQDEEEGAAGRAGGSREEEEGAPAAQQSPALALADCSDVCWTCVPVSGDFPVKTSTVCDVKHWLGRAKRHPACGHV